MSRRDEPALWTAVTGRRCASCGLRFWLPTEDALISLGARKVRLRRGRLLDSSELPDPVIGITREPPGPLSVPGATQEADSGENVAQEAPVQLDIT